MRILSVADGERAVQNAVLNKKQAKDLCLSLGIKYPTMMREINPYDKGAKLSFSAGINILRVAAVSDPDTVEAMCASLGIRLLEEEGE